MKKDEKIKSLVAELFETTMSDDNKVCATVVLSSFEPEDKGKIGNLIAVCGNPVGIANIISTAMEENEVLKMSIMLAVAKNFSTGMMGGDSLFPKGLDALLGGRR